MLFFALEFHAFFLNFKNTLKKISFINLFNDLNPWKVADYVEKPGVCQITN